MVWSQLKGIYHILSNSLYFFYRRFHNRWVTWHITLKLRTRWHRKVDLKICVSLCYEAYLVSSTSYLFPFFLKISRISIPANDVSMISLLIHRLSLGHIATASGLWLLSHNSLLYGLRSTILAMVLIRFGTTNRSRIFCKIINQIYNVDQTLIGLKLPLHWT